jgi:hydrogenase maturation protease
MRPVSVLVCGSALRGDDAAGLEAARQAAAADPGRIDLREVGQLTPELLLELEGRPCVVVDMVAGLPPGEIVERSLADLVRLGRDRAAMPGRTGATSSHALPLERALALAAVVSGRAPEGTFVGVGGERVTPGAPGAPMSEAVTAAIPEFTAAIGRAIRRLAGR